MNENSKTGYNQKDENNDFYIISSPIVSLDIKLKDPHDIDKLTVLVKEITRQDPTTLIWMEKETGKFLVGGIDPFQVKLIAENINERVEIEIGEPKVVYREKALKISDMFPTKSANSLNRILVFVEPLEKKLETLIKTRKLHELQDEKDRIKVLTSELNWDESQASKVLDVYRTCILVNDGANMPYFHKVKSYLVAAFRDWIGAGIIAKEPVDGIKVVIKNMEISEDSRCAGYNQISGMLWAGMSLAMLDADPHLFEPENEFTITTPASAVRRAFRIIHDNRGRIFNIKVESDSEMLQGKVPSSESTTLMEKLCSLNEETRILELKFSGFEKVPAKYEEKIILKLRKRKGMAEQIPQIFSWGVGVRGKMIEKASNLVDKILSIMETEVLKEVVIDRKYLLEFADPSLCIGYEIYLPELKREVVLWLHTVGIKVEVQGHAIKFGKLKK
ncbi:MAG: hypothetical protein JW891_08560 [Candidatus Lokiarchaeota archaeon]|nr:hypothetical protein [Candidatus Lokiarchaeota archaeon]